MITEEQVRRYLTEQGYFVENLWHVEDVNANLPDKIKMDILRTVLTSPTTIEFINEQLESYVREL